MQMIRKSNPNTFHKPALPRIPSRGTSPGHVGNRVATARLLSAVSLLLASLLVAGCRITAPQPAPAIAERRESTLRPDANEGPGGSAPLPELAEIATLDDLLRYAVRHSPALEAAFNEWRAATKRIPQARSLPDPQFSFGYVISQIDTRRSPRGETYRISQMFPWFGILSLRGGIAVEEALAAGQRYEAERWNLLSRVTDAYYESYYLERSIAIVQSNLELTRHLEQVARARFRADGAQQDVIRAQVELGRLADRLRSLEDLRGPIRAALNAALGRPAEAQLPPPLPENSTVAPPVTVRADEAWIVEALETNPELQALRHQVAARQEGVRLARRERFPDLMLGVEYGRNADARMAMMDGGGTDMLMGMVSIDLPIWTRRYSAAIEEAEARFESSHRQLEQRRFQIESDLKRALYAFRDAERKIDLYGDTLLPLGQQSYRVTEAAYRAADPQTTYLDLIDAQRVLLEFELSFERARADRVQRQADIERLLGRSLHDPAAGERLDDRDSPDHSPSLE
jgi:outer membrane protein, heavy metal efflux system